MVHTAYPILSFPMSQFHHPWRPARTPSSAWSHSFWERNANLLPTKDCVAIVTGEAAFLLNGSGDSPATELALKIRAG
jgi:hypothetical protein